MSCKRQELLALPEHLISLPVVGGVRVAHLLVFFVLFLCLVYQGGNQNPLIEGHTTQWPREKGQNTNPIKNWGLTQVLRKSK